MPKTNFCKPKNNEEQYRHSQNTYISEFDLITRNKEFIQYYDKSFNYRSQLMETDKTAFRVFDLLARYCENNNTIIITVKEIANILNKSERTVQRALRNLEDYNFLTVIRNGQHEYVYFLNPSITFNSKAEFKSKIYHTYSKFAGSVEIKMQIDNNIIDKNKLEEFVLREKTTFKFRLKNADFQEPNADEQIKKINLLESMDTEETEKHKYDYLDNDEFSTNTTINIFENIRKNSNFEDDEQF